jgi:hypothetical protein
VRLPGDDGVVRFRPVPLPPTASVVAASPEAGARVTEPERRCIFDSPGGVGGDLGGLDGERGFATGAGGGSDDSCRGFCLRLCVLAGRTVDIGGGDRTDAGAGTRGTDCSRRITLDTTMGLSLAKARTTGARAFTTSPTIVHFSSANSAVSFSGSNANFGSRANNSNAFCSGVSHVNTFDIF